LLALASLKELSEINKPVVLEHLLEGLVFRKEEVVYPKEIQKYPKEIQKYPKEI
jgi:hypothetical protein